MRCLLINPQAGQEPGRMVVAPDYVAKPDEFVVPEVPAGSVWDAATRALRPRTPSERLSALREERKREMGERSRAEFAAAYPYGGSVERDMMKRKLPTNPRTNRDTEIQDRLLLALQSIDAAGTAAGLTLEQAEAAIRAVQW